MAVLPHQLPMLSSYSAGCSPGQHTNPPTPPSQPCPGLFLSSRDGAPGEGRWGEITSSGSDQTPVGPHPGWEQDARPWEAGSPQSQCSVSQSALPAGSQFITNGALHSRHLEPLLSDFRVLRSRLRCLNVLGLGIFI